MVLSGRRQTRCKFGNKWFKRKQKYYTLMFPASAFLLFLTNWEAPPLSRGASVLPRPTSATREAFTCIQILKHTNESKRLHSQIATIAFILKQQLCGKNGQQAISFFSQSI